MGTMTQLMSSRGATMKSQIEERTGEEVLAVGQLKQGRTPSMTAMVLWVFGSVKVGIPPQVFAMGTVIFVTGVAIALAGLVAGRRSPRTA